MVFNDASITTSIIICDKNNNYTKALSLNDKNYDNIYNIIKDNSLYIDVEFNKNSNFVLQSTEEEIKIIESGN